MMEYFDNKKSQQCFHGLQVPKDIPVDILEKVLAAKLVDNQKILQELIVSELAKVQENIQKSMESQMTVAMMTLSKAKT